MLYQVDIVLNFQVILQHFFFLQNVTLMGYQKKASLSTCQSLPTSVTHLNPFCNTYMLHPSIKYFNISAHFPFNFPQICIYRYLIQDIHTVVDTQFLTGQCTRYSQMCVVLSCLVVV